MVLFLLCAFTSWTSACVFLSIIFIGAEPDFGCKEGGSVIDFTKIYRNESDGCYEADGKECSSGWIFDTTIVGKTIVSEVSDTDRTWVTG